MSGYLTQLLVTVIVFLAVLVRLPAQNAGSASAQESVIVTRLFLPVYPPLAKQTRITGDVELALEVRADGSLESAVVISGHPLLKQAALYSTQRSQFACRDCGQELRSFHVLYSFQLRPTSYCTDKVDTSKADDKREPYPRVTQSQNHITVVDQPVGTCDLAADLSKVRSIKCLYLWKCSLK